MRHQVKQVEDDPSRDKDQCQKGVGGRSIALDTTIVSKMVHNHKKGPRRVVLFLYLLWLSGVHVVSAQGNEDSSCVKEYGRCVMPRDCCHGLLCVAGDWQYTTDSTCLSPKSAEIEKLHLTLEMRRELVQAFYHKIHVAKTDEEVDHLLKKYRGEFPSLVSKLEGKYKTAFDMPKQQATEEL